jgi:G3E family GTPase
MQISKIYVLSGFLGAGKTSTIQYQLNVMPSLRETVVLVNEFGQLGIDGQILERPGLGLYQLVNGCICCLLEHDLIATMGRILDERNPQRILLEASGVADPENLRRSLGGSALRDRVSVAKVITVLDARMWKRRAVLGKLFHSQLAQADQILLNKTDLLGSGQAEKVEQAVRAAFPQAKIAMTMMGEVSPDQFWADAPGRFVPDISPAFFCGAPETEFVSCCLQSSDFVSQDRFSTFLAAPPTGLLRAKGQLLFADGSRRFFDWVDGRLDWHDPLDSIPGTHIILIGRNLNAKKARSELDSLLIQPA